GGRPTRRKSLFRVAQPYQRHSPRRGRGASSSRGPDALAAHPTGAHATLAAAHTRAAHGQHRALAPLAAKGIAPRRGKALAPDHPADIWRRAISTAGRPPRRDPTIGPRRHHSHSCDRLGLGKEFGAKNAAQNGSSRFALL